MNVDFSKIEWTDENINYPMETWSKGFALMMETAMFAWELSPQEVVRATWDAAIQFHIAREAELARRRTVVN